MNLALRVIKVNVKKHMPGHPVLSVCEVEIALPCPLERYEMFWISLAAILQRFAGW